MTPEALNALARDIAEAAAKCIRAGATAVNGHAITVIVPDSDWRVDAYALGEETDALRCAAVLALRDRVVAQREERARMLAADDAALRVIDETARIYDAATAEEAVDMACARFEVNAATRTANVRARLRDGKWPKTRREMEFADGRIADACDAILRRRAGTP